MHSEKLTINQNQKVYYHQIDINLLEHSSENIELVCEKIQNTKEVKKY